jgi:hypothetical protein
LSGDLAPVRRSIRGLNDDFAPPMTSIVWGRLPQEAYENPYEYEAQAQFLREANSLLAAFRAGLNRSIMTYHRDDRTLEKATWMLANDLVDALIEIAQLIEEKRHRVAARLFRDCIETIDFLTVLHSGTELATRALNSWYENHTIGHAESRQHIEAVEGSPSAGQRRAFYNQLSKFTHRTYLCLQDSYSLGQGELLVPDTYFASRMLVQPQTIAAYMAVLSSLILEAASSLSSASALPSDEISRALHAALETDTVPR